MGWFGWGENLKFKDKDGNMIDTSSFTYSYQFYDVYVKQSKEIDEYGYVLAEQLASKEKQTDFLNLTNPSYTDVVRHPESSDLGGKGVLLTRYKR